MNLLVVIYWSCNLTLEMFIVFLLQWADAIRPYS